MRDPAQQGDSNPARCDPLALTEGAQKGAVELFPMLYDELKAIALRYCRRERGDHTLQATALVHEAYLQLSRRRMPLNDRTHFLAVAARAMRHVLVDYSRERRRLKRGGGARRLSLSEIIQAHDGPTPDVEEVDEALAALATLDPLKAAIVELRFFGGLTIPEIGDCLGIAPITVSRHWRRARAWLFRELTPRKGEGSAARYAAR